MFRRRSAAPARDDAGADQVDPAFLAAARDFRRALGETADSTELRQLWRDTKLPYAMAETDPFSEAYRDQVRGVYRALTGRDYAVSAELTSTKQEDDRFQLGYPWETRDLGVIAVEMAKVVQALGAMAEGKPGRIVEFGAGWGNLALPLCKAGCDVTAVDIDEGFIKRLQRLAQEQQTSIRTYHGSFIDAAVELEPEFETAIFQSSFHHCLEFDELLSHLSSRLLSATGRILFLSEPIDPSYTFPWGIRYDGEALWAVMMNHWLELGFTEDFFVELLFRHGWLLSKVRAVGDKLGDGYCAIRRAQGMRFSRIILASCYNAGFHVPMPGDADQGRFVRRRAVLPGRGTASCAFTLQNFGPDPLWTTFRTAKGSVRAVVSPREVKDVVLLTGGEEIEIEADVFVPGVVLGNGDTREIGVAFTTIAWR